MFFTRVHAFPAGRFVRYTPRTLERRPDSLRMSGFSHYATVSAAMTTAPPANAATVATTIDNLSPPNRKFIQPADEPPPRAPRKGPLRRRPLDDDANENPNENPTCRRLDFGAPSPGLLHFG